MGKYLVTGAAGFIGSAIVKNLIENGHEIVTIDNLSTGKEENIPIGCKKIIGDVSDKSVIALLNNEYFDSIIHIAGQSSGEISFEDPIYDLNTNTASTLLLLNYAVKNGIKQFIYASSMAVYGDVEGREEVNEESFVIPKSIYAVGKLASEDYMRIFSQTYGVKCTALRFFNVYGPGQNMDNLKQGMASIYLAMAINDKHILVKGSPDRFRDFVYIDDVVHSVIKCINRNKGAKFEIINVSTDKKTLVADVVKTICEYLPYDVTVEYTTGTPGDQKGIYGINTKLITLLGFKPEFSFESGMKKMVEWAERLKNES